MYRMGSSEIPLGRHVTVWEGAQAAEVRGTQTVSPSVDAPCA